jgi:hypothetical protein
MMKPTNTSLPMTYFQAITPHDTNHLRVWPRAIKCDVDGYISFVSDTNVTITSFFRAGIWHPMRPKIIRASDTTATGIVAGW